MLNTNAIDTVDENFPRRSLIFRSFSSIFFLLQMNLIKTNYFENIQLFMILFMPLELTLYNLILLKI